MAENVQADTQILTVTQPDNQNNSVASVAIEGKLELKYDNSLVIRKIGLGGADLIFAKQPVELNKWTQ